MGPQCKSFEDMKDFFFETFVIIYYEIIMYKHTIKRSLQKQKN